MSSRGSSDIRVVGAGPARRARGPSLGMHGRARRVARQESTSWREPLRVCRLSSGSRMALPPLGELGWRGKYKHDSPEVQALRAELMRVAGVPGGVQAVSPDEPDFAQRAAQLFHRDGYCVVLNALPMDRVEQVREALDTVVRRMVEHDPNRIGNRGSHRYSMGSAPLAFGVDVALSTMIDSAPVLAVVKEIYGSEDFVCNGYGGDFVMPGSVEHQQLHRDQGEYLQDRSGGITHLDMPTARVKVSFPMVLDPGSPVAHTPCNGATRVIAGTHTSRAPIPSLAEEPRWMKLSVAAPMAAGTAFLFDPRCWHGGTPNLSNSVRALPGVGFVAPWYAGNGSRTRRRRIPRSVFERFESPLAKRSAAHLASDDEKVDSGSWRPDWNVETGEGGGGPRNSEHKGLVVARL